MDWLEKNLEEYYYLKFNTDGLSVAGLTEMNGQILAGKLKFSEAGAEIIINQIKDFFKPAKFVPGFKLKERDFGILECFHCMLESEPMISFVLDKLGPAYVLQGFPLHTYFLQEDPTYQALALKVVKSLMETCPKYNPWIKFVQSDDGKLVPAYLDKNLGKVAQPQQTPDSRQLAIRKQVSMANEIIGEAGLKSGLVDLNQTVTGQSVGSVVDNITSLLDRILKLNNDQIEEILDKGERLAVTSVQSAITNLRSMLDSADQVKIKEGHRVLVIAQSNLVTIQRGRRKRREQLFDDRLKYVEELYVKLEKEDPKRRTIIGLYKKNLAAQKRAIKALEVVYNKLADFGTFTDVSSELLFVDQQIANLYDVSISIVVAGLVKVGKSTVLNCLTGENLSPHRGSTMTAIPTRFVHDPNATEPRMLVPFSDELNSVAEKLKYLVDNYGMDNYTGVLGLDHCTLLLKIKNGLRFEPRYKGTKTILEASTDIHDLFRLAVNDIFQDDLRSELAIDWGQGLKSYLTVLLRFPHTDMITGLVNFSVIDSPGIDEAEVRKLNLHNTVKGALSASNFGIIVCANDGTILGDGYTVIKEMTKVIRQRYHTPMMVVATRSEDSTRLGQTRKAEIASALSADAAAPTFHEDEVFFVSGLRMFAGLRINEYVKQHDEKPSREHEDEWTRGIVRDFILVGGEGDDLKEKEEWYDGLSKETLLRRSAALMRASMLPDASNHIILTTIVRGIPIIIETTNNKVRDRLSDFLAQYRAPAEKNTVIQARAQAEREFVEMAEIVEKIKKELVEWKKRIKIDIGKLVDEILSSLRNFDKTPLPDTNKVTTFLGLLSMHIGLIQDSNVKDLVRKDGQVGFATDKDAQKAIIQLTASFKKAIEEHLSSPVHSLPEQLKVWSKHKHNIIETQLARVRDLFLVLLGLKLPKINTVSIDELFQDRISTSVNFAAQRIVDGEGVLAKITNTLKTFFGFKFKVASSVARAHLATQAAGIMESTTQVLYGHLDRTFAELTKIFVDEISTEVHSINDVASNKLWEVSLLFAYAQTADGKTSANARNEVIDPLEQSLHGLQNVSMEGEVEDLIKVENIKL